MKKLILGAVLVAAGYAVADTIRVREKNSDGVFVVNEYDVVDYAKKLIQQKTTDAWERAYYEILEQTKTSEAQAQVDSLLSEHKFYIELTYPRAFVTAYPKLFANYAKIYTTNFPEIVPLAEYIVSNLEAWDAKVKYALINAYIKISTHNSLSSYEVGTLLNCAPDAIKHKIRGEGRSFVTKDGINPIQVFVDKLVDAFNAPRLTGFDAALRECGMDYGLVFEEKLLSSEEVDTLKMKVLNGDVPFDASFGQKLRTHLGVDGYNKFVKLYNEGE